MFYQIKKFFSISLIIALFMMLLPTFAVLPPRYLAIKNFKRCLATKNQGTWTAWCLPSQKPDRCPASSWHQLNQLTGSDKIPAC